MPLLFEDGVTPTAIESVESDGTYPIYTVVDENGNIIWSATKVLFDTSDSEARCWIRATSPNNGWGTATCQTNGATATWNKIDCTGFNYCTVRIKGIITSTPSGSSSNSTDIRIGFTTDYNAATTVVNKWANSSGGSGQSGNAYNKWYDLKIDISKLSGTQTLNVFIGGAYQNGGTLYCSKITMHN